MYIRKINYTSRRLLFANIKCIHTRLPSALLLPSIHHAFVFDDNFVRFRQIVLLRYFYSRGKKVTFEIEMACSAGASEERRDILHRTVHVRYASNV